MIKRLTLLCLTIVLLYYLAIFCNKMTDNFSIAKIHSDLPYNPNWETSPLSEEAKHQLEDALSQKFHYLGYGGQCFVFASEDGNYVIKFFKHKIRKPYSLLLNISLPGFIDKKRQHRLNKILFKLNRDFTSYKIAFEELREETGLIYVQLNKKKWLNRTIHIIDKIGIEHSISLDDFEFIVQKKAQLIYPYIENLIQKNDLWAFKQTLHAICNKIICRSQKGIFDEDLGIHRNLGFIADEPIFMDVGRFVKDPARKNPLIYRSDLFTLMNRFRAWLNIHHPELLPLFDSELYEYQLQN